MKLTIRTKILFTIVTMVVLICSLFAFLVKERLERMFFQHLEKQSYTLAQHFVIISEEALLTEKFVRLSLLLYELKKEQNEIIYIFVQDSNHQVVAHSYQGGFPIQLNTLPLADDVNKYQRNIISDGTNKIMDIAVSVVDEELGTLHLGMSTAFSDKVKEQIIKTVGQIFLFALILSLFLAYILSRKLTHPLEELIHATEEFRKGNWDVSLPDTQTDEIGQLGKVFNRMVGHLHKTTVDRTEYQKQAEKLEIRNNELLILHDLSSKINRCTDFSSLAQAIIAVVTSSKAFPVRNNQGGLMLVKGDEMELIASTGDLKDFSSYHKNMKVGDCLCGTAAEKGEIIISKNCFEDKRHTIQLPNMTPHGHIILPIKIQDSVIAVLYLYTDAGDLKLSRQQYQLLDLISNQVSTAVENVRLLEDTKFLSYHDPLTTLPNRRYMEDFFSKCFFQAVRYDQCLAVIMMDIDYFKKFNDEFGHRAGDDLLVSLAKTLLDSVRESDFVVRYGGEEFLLILPNTSLKNGLILAERLRIAISKKTDCTVSIGISELDATYMKRVEDLVNKADKALYIAKNKGRNRVESLVE